MKNIKWTQSGVIYNKVRWLPKKFCNTFYTTRPKRYACNFSRPTRYARNSFLWLISNVPLAIAELRCVLWVPRSLKRLPPNCAEWSVSRFPIPLWVRWWKTLVTDCRWAKKWSIILNGRQKITVTGMSSSKKFKTKPISKGSHGQCYGEEGCTRGDSGKYATRSNH